MSDFPSSPLPPPPPPLPAPPVYLQYQSYVPPVKLRPTSVAVIAICGQIFGVLALLGLAIRYFKLLTPGIYGLGKTNADAFTFNYNLAVAVVSTVLVLLLIVGSIAAFKLIPWGRSALVWYGIARLAFGLTLLALSVTVVWPHAQARWARLGTTPSPAYMQRLWTSHLIYLGTESATLVIPCIIIYFMTRPHVKAAFARKTESAG